MTIADIRELAKECKDWGGPVELPPDVVLELLLIATLDGSRDDSELGE